MICDVHGAPFVTNHLSLMPSPLGENAFLTLMQYGITVMTAVAVEVQLLMSFTVRVYVVVDDGLAIGVNVLAPVRLLAGVHAIVVWHVSQDCVVGM